VLLKGLSSAVLHICMSAVRVACRVRAASDTMKGPARVKWPPQHDSSMLHKHALPSSG
jgi:hypothetical protein